MSRETLPLNHGCKLKNTRTSPERNITILFLLCLEQRSSNQVALASAALSASPALADGQSRLAQGVSQEIVSVFDTVSFPYLTTVQGIAQDTGPKGLRLPGHLNSALDQALIHIRLAEPFTEGNQRPFTEGRFLGIDTV